MRWLYHVRPREPSLAEHVTAPSLASDGFIHCSYADTIVASARLYFPNHDDLEILQIDPRRLDTNIEIAETPRGPMPHVHGAIPKDAIRARQPVDAERPHDVLGTNFVFLAFEGMTLLDLVGVLDPIRRIETMGFDPTSTRTIAGAHNTRVWTGDGARLDVDTVRPPLTDVDVLILPGGPSTTALTEDPTFLDWLRTFPKNRMLATVCTGALLAGAAGRLNGRRATTHQSAMQKLETYGATPSDQRVVVDGPITTAGGVTSGIDLGLHLVERLVGKEARDQIAARMEFTARARDRT